MNYAKGSGSGPITYRACLFRGQCDPEMWHCDLYPDDGERLMPTQVKGMTPATALRTAEQHIAWYGFTPVLRHILVCDQS